MYDLFLVIAKRKMIIIIIIIFLSIAVTITFGGAHSKDF